MQKRTLREAVEMPMSTACMHQVKGNSLDSKPPALHSEFLFYGRHKNRVEAEFVGRKRKHSSKEASRFVRARQAGELCSSSSLCWAVSRKPWWLVHSAFTLARVGRLDKILRDPSLTPHLILHRFFPKPLSALSTLLGRARSRDLWRITVP